MLAGRLKEFAKNSSGAVIINFAVGLVVLAAFTGLSVDYLRAGSTKSALQQNLDAIMLRVVRQKFADPSFDIQAAANQSMGIMAQRLGHAKTSLSVNVAEVDPTTYTGTAKVNVATALMRLLGFSNLNVVVSSTAKTGVSPIEIALVLDNTLSMQGSKLDALKSASKHLVDTILSAPNGTRYARIGIVPFSQYVNVGMANRNESWIDVPLDSSSTSNVCTDQAPATVVPGSCHEVTYPYTSDGEPMTGSYTQCDYTYGPSVKVCQDVTTSSSWHGCVGSRKSPWDARDENYSKRIPGVMDAWCATEITPLTDDQSKLDNAVDAMTATGDTYIPSGLLWGWLSLSEIAPYEAPAKIEGVAPKKIIVLMTDGFNTLSPTDPYDGTHNGHDGAVADANTKQLCTKIKSENIDIYTVAFSVTNSNVKKILQECATSPANFFDAADDTQLVQSFSNIANNLSALRLAQ